jgi:hypothetical protein
MNANKQQILDEITRKRAMWLNAIEQQEKGWKSQKLNGSRSLSGEQCDAIRELEDEVKKTHDDYHDYCRKTLDELLD